MLMLMMMIILCANNWLNGATFPGSIAVGETNLVPFSFSLFGVKYVKRVFSLQRNLNFKTIKKQSRKIVDKNDLLFFIQ